MIYMYDIFLNYNKFAYDIFEWNQDDNIIHVKKIPFIVISTEDLHNLLTKEIVLENNFYNKFYRKTEIFTKNDKYYIDYSFLATDKNEVIAFKIKKDGLIGQYSKLLPNDEIDVLNYSKNITKQEIKYEIKKNKKIVHYKTRNENKIKKIIYKEIKCFENDLDKLKFIYMECFGNLKSNDIINEFYNRLNSDWENSYIKLYNFIKKTKKSFLSNSISEK